MTEGWPLFFKEKLSLGSLDSNIGIATLWTMQEKIVPYLPKDSYCVVGNFYDRQNGLTPLVRNCLANPNIRYIVLVGVDKGNSREALVNFFQKGVDENNVVLETNTKVDIEIPKDALDLVRKNVELIDLSDQLNANLVFDPENTMKILLEKIVSLPKLPPYAQPQTFPLPKLETESFPSEKTGFMIRDQYIGDAWLKVLQTVDRFGTVTKMRTADSFQVKEVLNLVTVIEDEDPDQPIMKMYFRFDQSYLMKYYDEICTAHKPEGVSYTYGMRLREYKLHDQTVDQIKDITEFLRKDPYTKRAVAVTWNLQEESLAKNNGIPMSPPCLILVQPVIENNRLFLTAYIRSNDMFRAWPSNAFGLRKLQKNIAQELALEMASLTIVSCSAHIYQENWAEAKAIVNTHLPKTNCQYDIRGYFLISIDPIEKKILVSHFAVTGELLAKFEGPNARSLCEQLGVNKVASDPFHYMYLGGELQKAEIALQKGIKYTQDWTLEL